MDVIHGRETHCCVTVKCAFSRKAVKFAFTFRSRIAWEFNVPKPDFW